jgi:2,3-dihydroxybenzoate decarboxylase
VTATSSPVGCRRTTPHGYDRLYDRGSLRLEQMDAAGIQILSLFDPGVQEIADVGEAVDLAQRANDDLAETVRNRPDRFGGFATLATQNPAAAAAELERAVTELGLAGALINGRTHSRYLDDPAYRPLFECAEALGVPTYLHPTTPHPAVMEAWFAHTWTTVCTWPRGVLPQRRPRTYCG